jgi:hypothetical protein
MLPQRAEVFMKSRKGANEKLSLSDSPTVIRKDALTRIAWIAIHLNDFRRVA